MDLERIHHQRHKEFQNDLYCHNQKKNELMHHGILGQKWGIRRYQNPDGTLTEAGKKRYYLKKKMNAAITEQYEASSRRRSRYENNNRVKEINEELDRLYSKNEKLDPDGNTPYEKTLWPRINELHDELWDIDKKQTEEYLEELSKISEKFFDSYEKKYGDVKLQDLYDINKYDAIMLIDSLRDFGRADQYYSAW